MKDIVLIKAEEGKCYNNGSVYAKVVRVKAEWAEHWTLVSMEDAMANKNARIFPQVLHIKNEIIK